MKTFLKSLTIGIVGTIGVGVFSSKADLEVVGSVRIGAKADFYEPLAAHGAWIEVGHCGRCWHPARVAVEWQPYSYGHWVWTDCGWFWESDEPWGWACYHYGSWVYDPVYSWVWVPDIEWAPAWVSWRVGGGYIGWAPLPPRGVVVASVPASPFIFVETARFREPLKPSLVVVNNRTILSKTTVINNIRTETRTFGGASPQKVMVNEGPGADLIQKATASKISATPIREVARKAPAPAAITHGATEVKANDKPSVVRGEPRLSPERNLRPKESDGPIPRPVVPGAGKRSRGEEEKGHGNGRGK